MENYTIIIIRSIGSNKKTLSYFYISADIKERDHKILIIFSDAFTK